MSRSTAALGGLVLVAVGLVGDALVGGDLVDLLVVSLVVAGLGYAVGLWATPREASAAVCLAAACLTAASQLHAPQDYPILDDLLFFLVLVGGPALAGAAVAGRARQAAELSRLADLLERQRAVELRAARAEERTRIEVSLHRGFTEDLAAIVMRVEGARRGSHVEQRRALAQVESAARDTLDRLRESLGLLRATGDPRAEPAPEAGSTSRPSTLPTTDDRRHPPERRLRRGSGEAAGHPGRAFAGLGPADVVPALVCTTGLVVESLLSPKVDGPLVLTTLLALLTGAALLARRRYAVATTAACLFAMLVLARWVVSPLTLVSTIPPILLAAYSVGAHSAGRRRRTGTAVLAAGWAGLVLLSPPERDVEGIVAGLVWTALALAAGTVTAGWAARAARLRDLVAELERGREAELRLAAAEQRMRTASDLHDTVAHALTVVCLQSSAGQVAGADRLEGILGTVVDAARSGLVELRSGLEMLGEAQAMSAEELAAQARRSGLSAEVTVRGPVDTLPDDVRLLAARVLRESLVNAGRYAPGSHVRVCVDIGRTVALDVTDTGGAGGSWSHGSGSGLRSLRSDVERSGGTMTWGRSTGGFRVTAALPLQEVRA